jgi:hypothetical protein
MYHILQELLEVIPSSFKDFLQHISIFATQPSDIHPWKQATWYFILECAGGVNNYKGKL